MRHAQRRGGAPPRAGSRRRPPPAWERTTSRDLPLGGASAPGRPRWNSALLGILFVLLLLSLSWDRAGRASSTSPAEPLRVLDYGPKRTPAGVAFNPQAGGGAAIWVQTSGATPFTVVRFGGDALASAVAPDGNLVTAMVPAPLYAEPRTVEIVLYEPLSRTTSQPVRFEITEP
jgi:hypothetical protein